MGAKTCWLPTMVGNGKMELKASASLEQVLLKCTDSPRDTTVMESAH